MICVGGLAIVPAHRLANNCAHFSSCLCVCIFICWLFTVLLCSFIFPLEAILIRLLLLVHWLFFYLPLGREGRPRFQLERKTWDVLLLSCTEMGSEIDVAFLDKYMRSSLSGGIALFPTFLGQSVSLNTASKFLIWQWKKKRKKISARFVFSMR